MIRPTSLYLIKNLQSIFGFDLQKGAFESADGLIGKINEKIVDVQDRADVPRMMQRLIPALGVNKTNIKLNPDISVRALKKPMILYQDSDSGKTYGVQTLPIIITYACTIIVADIEQSEQAIGDLFWYFTGGNTSFAVPIDIRGLSEEINITCQIRPDTFQGTSPSEENTPIWEGGKATKVEWEMEVSTFLFKPIFDEPMTTINCFVKDIHNENTFFNITEVGT